MEYVVENYHYTPGAIEETANNYAFMHSSAFSQIVGTCKKKTSSKKILEGYLRVTSKSGKSIYLKYIGWNGVKQNEIQLSYYNKCALDVEVGDKVKICSTRAMAYYWRSWDSGIRIPFKIAIYGLAISILSGVLSMIL